MSVQTAEANDNEPMDTTEVKDTNGDAEENSLNVFDTIIDAVLSKNSLSSTDYDSLGEIARVNPPTIETKLHRIFKKILLQDKSSQKDINSYEKLMSDIIDACIRLRRDQKIASCVLMALNESLKDIGIIEKNAKTNSYILPQDFIDKFSATISDLTTSQVGSVLISLIYHLDSCVRNLEEKNLLMPSGALITFSKVIRQLTIAFLEGVDMFDPSWSLSGKKKFVNGLANLGETLLKVIKSWKRNIADDDHRIIRVNLWKIVASWQTIIGLIKHHVPDAVSENNLSDISNFIEDIKGVLEDFESNEESEEYLVFLKLKKNRIQCVTNLSLHLDVCERSNNEVHDSEQFWNILVDKYSHTFHNLSHGSISKLAELLIENSHSSSEILTSDSIQNHGNLVTALILVILKKMNAALRESTSTTKSLLDEIDEVNWWQNEKRQKALKSFKKIFATSKWSNLNDKNVLSDIIKYLKSLSNLPLRCCTTDLKTIIFLIILSTKKETLNESTIGSLCTEILLEISERYNGNLLQYIQPEILVLELSKSQQILSRVVESSLKNLSNYKSLKQSLKSHLFDKNTSTIMMDCMGKLKLKLKTPMDKELLVKFEKKLLKRVLSDTNNEFLNINHLKTLKVALKAAVTLKKVDDNLMNKIHTTLDTLTKKRNDKDDMNDIKFTNESYQLIKVVLQYRTNGVSIDSPIIKNIWSLMLEKACTGIVSILIEASDMKIFHHALHSIREHTRKSLKKNDEKTFENCVSIWNTILKANMGANREKIRQNSLQDLMQLMKAAEISMNDNMRLDIIKLSINIVSSKRMMLADKTINLILIVVNSYMQDSTVTLTLSQQTLHLCSSFLKFRPGKAIVYLPIISRLYLKAIQTTVEDARKSCDQQQLQCLIILEIQKLASAFVKLKKDMAKLSPYIIADMIGIYYGKGLIPNYVKEPLDDSVSQFLSICDQYAISLLFRGLPPSMQEIFKKLYDTYIKFYKFTGKV